MDNVKELQLRLGVGPSVAAELLVLSGGDMDLAESMSKSSTGLDQCKAAIIDARFRKLEGEIQCEPGCRENSARK